MEGGEDLFLLSSGFNSTLSEYHNTKFMARTIWVQVACFASTVMGGKAGVLVRGLCQASSDGW